MVREGLKSLKWLQRGGVDVDHISKAVHSRLGDHHFLAAFCVINRDRGDPFRNAIYDRFTKRRIFNGSTTVPNPWIHNDSIQNSIYGHFFLCYLLLMDGQTCPFN